MELEQQNQAYRELGPDQILNAVEARGYRCDGHLLALNSYENRVYQVGLEDEKPLVVKFYRPGRWSDEAIHEEHRLAMAALKLEIPVVAPLQADDGETLHHFGPFRFAMFPRRGGRAPDLESPEHRMHLGRFLGRLHNLGAARPFKHRPTLDVAHFGTDSIRFVLDSGLLPGHLDAAYAAVAQALIEAAETAFERAGQVVLLRTHGDCHSGNLLWRDDGLQVVDLDDARMAPAVQDIWMFLAGHRDEMQTALDDVLEGYTAFRAFNPRELHLIEAFRALRMLHYAAWLGRRWDDPAFPRAFPFFNTPRYWEDHVLSLREQLASLSEPPLRWHG